MTDDIDTNELMYQVLCAVLDRIDLWGQDEDLQDWVAPAKVILGDLIALQDRLKSPKAGGFN